MHYVRPIGTNTLFGSNKKPNEENTATQRVYQCVI